MPLFFQDDVSEKESCHRNEVHHGSGAVTFCDQVEGQPFVDEFLSGWLQCWQRRWMLTAENEILQTSVDQEGT